MVSDKGVSAWTGANLTEGAFGQFLTAAKSGQIKAGSYLLVESLDRISRQQVRNALVPFMELINADIVIVTLSDDQVYSKATVDANFTQLIVSLTIMARAHEESETKSKRLKAVAANRKRTAAKGVGRFSATHVGWIKSEQVGPNKWDFTLNEHAGAVRRIFQLADSGIGQVTIARRLNEEKIPTFRGKGFWFAPNVGRILRDESVVGTYQPTHVVEGVRQSLGQPIRDYYPAVISDELFWRVQRGIKVGYAKGRHKGNSISNLFSGLVACSQCGNSLRLRTGTPHKYLYCDNLYRTANCSSIGGLYRYDKLEEIVFSKLVELDPEKDTDGKADGNFRDALLKVIQANEAEIPKQERVRKNLMASLALIDDDETRRDVAAQMNGARTRIEQLKAKINEQKEDLANIEAKRHELASFAERLNLERLSWANGTTTDVFDSRSRVARMLKRIIVTMTIDLGKKELMIAVAGGLRAYKFSYSGDITERYDMGPIIDRPAQPVFWTDRDGGTTLVSGGALKPEHFTTDIQSDLDAREDRLKIVHALSKREPIVNPRLDDPDVQALKARRAKAKQR